MIRWEAVLIALFGAVLGVASGLLFGWGAVSALPEDSFGSGFTIPVADIATVVSRPTIGATNRGVPPSSGLMAAPPAPSA
jgi:ABC-type antimicrobial peptide transport system permease subunit